MNTSTMTLDAYKMMLVQKFVQGISRAQDRAEVNNTIESIYFTMRNEEKSDKPAYTRTELDEMMTGLIDELQYGSNRPREQVWGDINRTCALRDNAPWYTREEINASLDKFRVSIEAGEGISHEQAMKEIDEFMKCL